MDALWLPCFLNIYYICCLYYNFFSPSSLISPLDSFFLTGFTFLCHLSLFLHLSVWLSLSFCLLFPCFFLFILICTEVTKHFPKLMDGKSHPWVKCNDRHTNPYFSINPAKWLGIVWVVKYASLFIRIWRCRRQNHSLTAQKIYTAGTHYILHSWMNSCSAHWRLGFILR